MGDDAMTEGYEKARNQGHKEWRNERRKQSIRLENYIKKVGGKEEDKEISNDTEKEGHSL